MIVTVCSMLDALLFCLQKNCDDLHSTHFFFFGKLHSTLIIAASMYGM